MAAASTLAALRAVATRCQVAAWSFTNEQAAEGFTVIAELRDLFLLPPAAASTAMPGVNPQPHPHLLQWLQLLPTELLSVVLSHLTTCDLACLAATCRPLWRDAPAPPPRPMPLVRPMGPVETELRRRATARGLRISSSLPKGALSWVPYLLKCVLRDALRREAPLAVGVGFSLFVDEEGRLLTCGSENSGEVGELLLGHDWGANIDPDDLRSIGPPTLVPSMQDRRIISVAASNFHCLALSCEGEVFSWGDGEYGSLGHADEGARAVPSRIESLSRVERIAAGPYYTSAAVDEGGRLFTWGQATSQEDGTMPSQMPCGLGYALDTQARSQLTPKWVDALSADRVVGVALGFGFTLAVTDPGAVFSFGYSQRGALGHGSLEGSEVLPRQIEALAQTGRRYVAVAAGECHALAVTEEGELYGWGDWEGNGHGANEPTPRQVTAFVGQRVKHVNAGSVSACAVTETGELYTWGRGVRGELGHGDRRPQLTPRRVEGLSGVKVAAAATCYTHILVAGEDGVVWGFGGHSGLGLGDPDASPQGSVCEEPTPIPTPIPTLRVRAGNSPDVLPFR